jgi:hypothetical protein
MVSNKRNCYQRRRGGWQWINNEYTGYSPRQRQPYPSLGPYIGTIDKWLENDRDVPTKHI